jgi:hypothetical protein
MGSAAQQHRTSLVGRISCPCLENIDAFWNTRQNQGQTFTSRSPVVIRRGNASFTVKSRYRFPLHHPGEDDVAL